MTAISNLMGGLQFLALLSLFPLMGCTRPAHVYHYRLILAVRDHGKLIKASSVVKVTERATMSCGGTACFGQKLVCGEATVLPLTHGRYLLALLNGASNANWRGWSATPTKVLLHNLGLNALWEDDPSGIESLAKGSRPVLLSERDDMPQFVVVRDKNDPLSFSGSPWPSYDPAWLGNGVVFDSVTIQATKDPVTTGSVAKAFPWLSSYDDSVPSAPSQWDGKKRMAFKVKQFARCDRF